MRAPQSITAPSDKIEASVPLEDASLFAIDPSASASVDASGVELFPGFSATLVSSDPHAAIVTLAIAKLATKTETARLDTPP